MTLSALNSNWNLDDRLNVNGNNWNDNNDSHAFGIVLFRTYNENIQKYLFKDL